MIGLGIGKPKARRHRRILALVLLGGVGLAVAALRAQPSPRPQRLPSAEAAPEVEDVALRDLRGQRRSPRDWLGKPAAVLFFLGVECPVSNGYAPLMKRLAETYGPRGVAVVGVHPDPDLTPEAAARHASEFGLDFPILLDPNQELARQIGVQVTPEAAVLDGEGHLRYAGRIDDHYGLSGKRRESPSKHDLIEALEAVLAERAPAVARTRAFGCPLPAISESAEGAAVTFHKDVAPILWSRCAPCHRPGAVGPFSLLTYRDAARRAEFLHNVTASRRMPPWKPVHGFGHFLDEPRLTARELAILETWADLGAPEGDPAERGQPPNFPDGWQLGTPDLVLAMPEPFAVPAGGVDVYRAFVLPIPLDHDQPIAAVEFRPGNRKIVHHARLYADATPDCRRRDADDPGLGFASFGGADIAKPGLGEWLPGVQPRFPPPGVGKLVKAGSDLVLLVHYHGTGKAERDRSSVGLYFSKGPIERSMGSIPLSTANIDIPAGDARHTIKLEATLPADVHAHAVLPHGHYLLREMKLRAILPDGTVRRLLWIRDWDFNWQGEYHYARPVPLPRGSKLEVVAVYDNSAANPSNPNHPPRRVRYGPGSTDEMLGCHLRVLGDRPEDDRAIRARWPLGL